MKKMAMIVALLAMAAAGCSATAGPYADYVWENRAEFIYGNDQFNDDRKVNEIYLLGAAREMDPDEVKAELAGTGLVNDEEGESNGE